MRNANITYDQKANALYIGFHEDDVIAKTMPTSDKDINIDYVKKDKITGIEILNIKDINVHFKNRGNKK